MGTRTGPRTTRSRLGLAAFGALFGYGDAEPTREDTDDPVDHADGY